MDNRIKIGGFVMTAETTVESIVKRLDTIIKNQNKIISWLKEIEDTNYQGNDVIINELREIKKGII